MAKLGILAMIGKTISHYKILEKLGSGGMGTVFTPLDKRVQGVLQWQPF